MIMIGAKFLFDSKYSQNQLFGAAGAVVAIIFYSQATIKEKEKKKKVETFETENDQVLPLIQTTPRGSKNPSSE